MATIWLFTSRDRNIGGVLYNICLVTSSVHVNLRKSFYLCETNTKLSVIKQPQTQYQSSFYATLSRCFAITNTGGSIYRVFEQGRYQRKS